MWLLDIVCFFLLDFVLFYVYLILWKGDVVMFYHTKDLYIILIFYNVYLCIYALYVIV